MTRINFGWAIGKTLEAKAYQEDGSYRESDIALSDMTGKGLYLGASTSDLTPSDDVLVFFFSSRRRHTRSCLVSWARRCV